MSPCNFGLLCLCLAIFTTLSSGKKASTIFKSKDTKTTTVVCDGDSGCEKCEDETCTEIDRDQAVEILLSMDDSKKTKIPLGGGLAQIIPSLLSPQGSSNAFSDIFGKLLNFGKGDQEKSGAADENLNQGAPKFTLTSVFGAIFGGTNNTRRINDFSQGSQSQKLTSLFTGFFNQGFREAMRVFGVETGRSSDFTEMPDLSNLFQKYSKNLQVVQNLNSSRIKDILFPDVKPEIFDQFEEQNFTSFGDSIFGSSGLEGGFFSFFKGMNSSDFTSIIAESAQENLFPSGDESPNGIQDFFKTIFNSVVHGKKDEEKPAGKMGKGKGKRKGKSGKGKSKEAKGDNFLETLVKNFKSGDAPALPESNSIQKIAQTLQERTGLLDKLQDFFNPS